MINFDGKEMQEEFAKAFGFDISNASGEQLWWLVKFAKHVRGRCRNNSAFNNYMSRNFPNARFREVPKEYNGRSYMGLQIVVNGQNFDDNNMEE